MKVVYSAHWQYVYLETIKKLVKREFTVRKR